MPNMLDVTRGWQDAVLLAYENLIHYHAPEMRWYSRDPQTLRWRNDRMVGRRFLILTQMLPTGREELEALSPLERRFVLRLHNRPGQYEFLTGLSRRYWDLPLPADWDTNREGS